MSTEMSHSKLPVPMKGDILLGQVLSVGDKISTVLVSIMIRQNKTPEIVSLPRVTHAYIFKKDANFPCTRLGDILKLGDLVLGLVKIDWFRPVFISFEGEEFGIVAASCSRCGASIPAPKSLNKLICPRCMSTRETKVSSLYEPILWREIHRRYRVHIYSSVQ